VITSLELHNWRTYDHLLLPVGSGATFIVAPNGVGKSSIIEGARFATFGQLDKNRDGVRKLDATGPTTATVTIALDGQQTLRITRTVPVKKKAEPVVDASLNGEPVQPDDLERLLEDAFGADVAFLDRMSMMSGAEVLGNAQGIDLRAHLSAFLGLSGVERAIVETDRLLKIAAADVEQHRNAARVTATELDALRAAADAARTRLATADEAVAAAKEVLGHARADRTAAERAAEAAARADAREAALAELATEATTLTGTPATTTTVDDVLALAELGLNEQVEQIRRRRAELDGRIAAATASLEELTGTSGSCPVCRRPLDPEDLATARAGHEEEIAGWEAERDGLDEVTASDALRRTSALRATVLRHGAAPAAPADTPGVDDTIAAETAAAAALDTVAIAAAETRGVATAAQTALSEAEAAASAMDAVIAAFERQATLEAIKDALTQAGETLLTEGIDPLEEALQERWTNLFEHRTGLTLDGAGTVARLIGDNTLTFRQFSDGERMAAQLLLRVLVLQATTRLPFLWIDEPLEHLDPDARRALSLLLTTAPQQAGGPLRQVVMTTYEEPLVRRLQGALEGTNVTYVRAAGT
jgi:DNA repair exonuclease SbcCD ATPase subunit